MIERIKAGNPDNVRDVISILEGVKARDEERLNASRDLTSDVRAMRTLNMSNWQKRPVVQDIRPKTLEQAIDCGMACCLGGWTALSERFQSSGGTMSSGGAPVYQVSTDDSEIEYYGGEAIAIYFGVPIDYGFMLTAIGENYGGDTAWKQFYNVELRQDIHVDQVIAKLKELLP